MCAGYQTTSYGQDTPLPLLFEWEVFQSLKNESSQIGFNCKHTIANGAMAMAMISKLIDYLLKN